MTERQANLANQKSVLGKLSIIFDTVYLLEDKKKGKILSASRMYG